MATRMMHINKFRLFLSVFIVLAGVSCTLITDKTAISHSASPGIMVELLTDEEGSSELLQVIRDNNEIHKFPIAIIFQEFGLDYSIYTPVVRDLDKDNESEVVLEIFTRGSNCCTAIAVIYYDQNSDQYKSSNLLIKNWGISPKLVDIGEDKIFEFVTRDPDHSWLAPPAAAVAPIQVFRFSEGQLTDVTIQYPDLLQQDANLWLASAQGQIANVSNNYLDVTQVDPEYLVTALKGKEQISLSTYLYEMTLLGKGDEGLIQVNATCKDIACTQYFSSLYQEIQQEQYGN